MTTKELSRRQARDLDTLSEFNFQVVFRPGKRNEKADALTRMPGSTPTDKDDPRLQQQRQVPKDPLARRAFRATSTLASGKRKHVLEDSLVDCGCTGAHTVINEAIIPEICEKLGIEPLPLSTPEPLRGYDGQLSKKPITHFILPALIVNGHRESTCPMLIAPL